MRDRLVIAFVGLTVAVIGLYGIPRAYFLADLVRDQETTTVNSTASTLASLARERTEGGGDVDESLLETGLAGADWIDYFAADGRVVSVGVPRLGEEALRVLRRHLAGGRSATSRGGRCAAASAASSGKAPTAPSISWTRTSNRPAS